MCRVYRQYVVSLYILYYKIYLKLLILLIYMVLYHYTPRYEPTHRPTHTARFKQAEIFTALYNANYITPDAHPPSQGTCRQAQRTRDSPWTPSPHNHRVAIPTPFPSFPLLCEVTSAINFIYCAKFLTRSVFERVCDNEPVHIYWSVYVCAECVCVSVPAAATSRAALL